jgi:subtilisin family serine protease/subtilisin-like proprotein convertase family protein
LEVLEDRTALSGSAAPASAGASFDRDHILVQYRQGQSAFALPGTSLGSPVGSHPGLFKVNLGTGVDVGRAVAAYRADARVAEAEPDYLLVSGALPNDPRLGEQWGLRNTGRQAGEPGADIGASRAWVASTGSTRMVVAVMDTGVDYTHPDLYLNIWINQGEIPASRRRNLRDTDGDGLITFRDLNNPINKGRGKITDLNHNGRIDAGDLLMPMRKGARGVDTGLGGWANGVSDDHDRYVDDLVGWNFADNNNKPRDDFGHGTQVAGVIGAVGNNGVGVAGVAWRVQMMPVKFMNSSGSGSISDFIDALDYAVAHGAKISNNSWAGADNSSPLADAIRRARSRGHIFVAAAGNSGDNNDRQPTYPAGFRFDNVVSVAATDRDDRLAAFSNYGARTVTLAAPGVDVLSTAPGGGYTYQSGTSMATPQVTGVVALVWAEHPTWSYQQVIRRLTSTVRKLPALAGKTITGGRLDAAAAVGASGGTSAPAPRVVRAVPGGPRANTLSKVRVTFDRPMSASTFAPGDVRLVGPNGRVIPVRAVRAVAGTGGRAFEVSFATQAAAGTYTMRIGPEVRDLSRAMMTAWAGTFKLGRPAPAARSYSSSVRKTIFPRGRAVSLLKIADNVTIGDINVRVSVTHPRDRDLVIRLQAPNGTLITLFQGAGGSSRNLVNTVFDDQAKTPVARGKAPFTGSFRPATPLSRLNGKKLKGTWKLWVEDRGGKFRGTLTGWSLTVKPKGA